jgi:hypothetical protein
MGKPLGQLKVNNTEFFVQDADCSIFVGRLDVDTATTGGDLAIRHIPFPSAVTFEQIAGKNYSCADCTRELFENSIFSPTLFFRNDYCTIRSIEFASKDYSNGNLQVELDLKAVNAETGQLLSVAGTILAECYPIDRFRLLYGHAGPIPIRFAGFYFPLIGLPIISDRASCSEITSVFGLPDHQGGGLQPDFGIIPKWIRYTLPDCYLHFQFENDLATQVTIMSLSDPPCDIKPMVG